MAKTWNAGVIGCGAIAQALHLPGYAKHKGTNLVAACDPEPARHREARTFNKGLRCYTDYREMLAAETLDMVSVCSPNALHAEHTIAALKHGAHVFLEKPPTLRMADIRKIEKVRSAAGRQLMVGFSHRFMRGNQKTEKMLAKGTIGEPYMFRVRFAHTGPFPGWARDDWFYDPELAGGGALFDMGIHAIDLALWLIGPVQRVQCKVATLRKDIPLEDNASMILQFENGRTLGYIDVGWTSPVGFTGVEILGDEGWIYQDYNRGMWVTRGKVTPDLKRRPKMTTKLVDEAPNTGGWPVEVPEAYKAFRAGGDRGLGIDAGGRALAVALAAYKSSRTGKAVEVASIK